MNQSWVQTFTILGVNLAIFAILVNLSISNASRIDQCNQRLDNVQMMIYDTLKDIQKAANH